MTLWRVVDNDTGQVYAWGLLEYEANMISVGYVSDGKDTRVEPDR